MRDFDLASLVLPALEVGPEGIVVRCKIKSINKFKLRVSFGTCSYSVQQNFN